MQTKEAQKTIKKMDSAVGQILSWKDVKKIKKQDKQQPEKKSVSFKNILQKKLSFIFAKKTRVATFGISLLAIVIIVISFQFFGSKIKGATYGWLQSTWSGGADTSAAPTHTNNQSNWTKYYSSEGLNVGDSLKLERTSSGD